MLSRLEGRHSDFGHAETYKTSSSVHCKYLSTTSCLIHTYLTVTDVKQASGQAICLWRAEPFVVWVGCGIFQFRCWANKAPQRNALPCLDILLEDAIHRPGTERDLA